MYPTNTSFSELSTLADCERKWWYRYVVRPERGETAQPLALGSLVHTLIGKWWDSPFMVPEEVILNLPAGTWDEANEESRITALWLLDRYHRVYQDVRDTGQYRVIGTELKNEVMLPGTNGNVVQYLDQLFMDDQDRFWLVERKTMKDWRKLAQAMIDPQLTLYLWGLRDIGVPVAGVIFDCIRTYRWKRDEHPPQDSFEWARIDRSPEHTEEAMADMQAAYMRRQMLTSGLRPIRNLGRACDSCDFRDHCWDELAGYNSFGVELDDE